MNDKMCDTVFTIGQRGGYFLECPSQWQFAQLPEGLAALFSDKKVAVTYCTVIGARESYLISYKGKDGMQYISSYSQTPILAYQFATRAHKQPASESEDIPETLREWLYQKDSLGSLTRHLDQLKVTLGPANESYFATDGVSSKWDGLPQTLSDALEKRRKPDGWTSKPRIVSLGFAQSFVYITDANGGAWDVSNYRTLDASIDLLREKEGGLALIQNLVLNPYRLQNFVLQTSTGVLLADGAPPHMKDALTCIEAAVKSDSEMKNLREMERQISIAKKQADLEKWRSRLILAKNVAQILGALSGLNDNGSKNDGSSNSGRSNFDAASFWQPLLDATNMSNR